MNINNNINTQSRYDKKLENQIKIKKPQLDVELIKTIRYSIDVRLKTQKRTKVKCKEPSLWYDYCGYGEEVRGFIVLFNHDQNMFKLACKPFMIFNSMRKDYVFDVMNRMNTTTTTTTTTSTLSLSSARFIFFRLDTMNDRGRLIEIDYHNQKDLIIH